MNIKILQAENSIENVSNSVISALYNAHTNGDISLEVDNNNQKVGLVGSITAPAGYGFLVSTLNGAYPKFHVTVNSEYVAFTDPNVENILKINIGDGTGVSFNDLYAITNDSQLGLGSNATAHPEITDFREGCLLTGLTSLSTGFAALSGVTIFGFPPNVVNYPGGSFASNIRFDGVVVKNINNFINRGGTNLWFVNGYYLYDMDNNGNLTRIDTLTLPSAVSFPNGVNKDCLCGVKLEELIIPSSCTYITSLSGPYLKKISFESPSSLTTIEANTFWYGPSWTNSIVQLDIANLPLTITTIGDSAFRNCSNVTGVLDLPNLSLLVGNAFYAAHITGITSLGSITSIPASCFYNCGNLTSVVLPASCTSIGQGAFANDLNLTTINLANITSIGGDGLSKTKITNVDMPSLQSITGNWAFANCTSLTTVTDLGSITSIPNGSFQNCTALTSVTLPSTCISLDNLAFGYCNSLTDINLSNVKSIGYKCFDTCNSLTNINLSSLINYGRDSFVNCGNISITLPSLSINSGSYGMFGGNTRLLNVYGSVENWTTIHRNFPKFSDISSGIDVLYFKNATSIYAPKFGVNNQFGDEAGLGTTSNSNVGTKAMYVPKLQEISCGITNTYNRLISVFGIGVQEHIGGGRLKIDLLYFKDLLEIKSSPFGGLLCNALVINKSVPPTITPLTYSTIAEYTTSVNNVKVNAWGELEDATDPNATITGTTTYGWDYSLTKKLRHTPYITAIYVPDSDVNTYKTTTGWTSVASLIQPISSLNSGVVYATLLDWETAGKPVGLIAECLDLSTADLATFMLDNNLTYWTNQNA